MNNLREVESDDLIMGQSTPDVMFSDRRTLLFQLRIPRPSLNLQYVSFRKLQSVDREVFMNEISISNLCTSNTDDPDQLCALIDNLFALYLSVEELPFVQEFHG